MKLMNGLLNRKIVVSLLSVLVIIFGVLGMNRLDRELLPAMDFNMVMVSISAGDLPALDVEEQITEPFEQVLDRYDAVVNYQSTTGTGSSSIFIETESGETDALVRDLDSEVGVLATNVAAIEYTDVMAMGTNQDYEFFMSIADGDMEEMTAFGHVIENRLEALPEVRDVRLSGFEESSYEIVFEQESLLEHGIHLFQAVEQIQASNVNVSVGELTVDNDAMPIRWNTSFSSSEELDQMKLQTAKGPVALRDLANIETKAEKESSMAWMNGSSDFIFVEIGRADGVTQLDMATSVRGEVTEIQRQGLDEGLAFEEVVNQADYVSSAIDGVSQNILIGGLLALGVLMLFLRNVRATLIVGITIPLSILLTFASLWLLDYSINMLTLIGLGLGIGMMVDAAIVILESIYRKKEQGLPGREAVLTGLREVSSAVIASMLTTVVVFLPVGLFGGDFAVFILILSVVVVVTLLSSVLISFSLIPSLSEQFLKLKKNNQDKRMEEGLITRKYGALVNWLTQKKRRRYGVMLLFLVVFVSSLALTTRVPFTLMPDVMDRYAETGIDLEGGLTSNERSEIVQAAQLKLDDIDDVESVIMIDGIEFMFALINMTKGDAITTPQEEVNLAITEALRELEEEYPVTGTGMMVGGQENNPVQLYVKGEDDRQSKTLSEQLERELGSIEGVVNVSISNQTEMQERQFVFHEARIDDAGITKNEVLQQIQGSLSTVPVGMIRENGLDVPILASSGVTLETEQDLADMTIITNSGERYPLSEFASLESRSTPGQITRTNGERYLTVSGDIEGRDLGAVNRDVLDVITAMEIPPGFTIETAGDLQAQQELVMDLLMIVGISLVLVYMVMAVQFNSFIQPVIVMTVIPLTATGSILALFLTQRELSVLSALGVLMLIGIVLNNAILLIDRINQLRKQGFTVSEAVVEAGKNRIRPIFMTTLTTVGGMLPLAIATGTASGYQGPLATVIIGGLLFATFITLLLIPSVYLMTEDVKRAIKSRLHKPSVKSVPVEEAAS